MYSYAVTYTGSFARDIEYHRNHSLFMFSLVASFRLMSYVRNKKYISCLVFIKHCRISFSLNSQFYIILWISIKINIVTKLLLKILLISLIFNNYIEFHNNCNKIIEYTVMILISQNANMVNSTRVLEIIDNYIIFNLLLLLLF